MRIQKILFLGCALSLGRDAVPGHEQIDPRIAQLQQAIESGVAEQNYQLQHLTSLGQVESGLKVQVNELEGRIRAHNDEVEAYLWNHKMAALCMAAAGVALTPGNEYSDDVQGMGVVGAVVCTLAFASDGNFRREVITVADQLVQADTHAKNLQSQKRDLESQLYRQRSQAAAARSQYDSLVSSVQNLRLELGSLSTQ